MPSELGLPYPTTVQFSVWNSRWSGGKHSIQIVFSNLAKVLRRIIPGGGRYKNCYLIINYFFMLAPHRTHSFFKWHFHIWSYLISQSFFFFFYFHLGFSLYFTVVCLCHITRGVPPPGGGIVGKKRSTRMNKEQ